MGEGGERWGASALRLSSISAAVKSTMGREGAEEEMWGASALEEEGWGASALEEEFAALEEEFPALESASALRTSIRSLTTLELTVTKSARDSVSASLKWGPSRSSASK